MGIAEIGGFFCLRFRHNFFLGIPDFRILQFQKIFFKKIQILRFHRKMCRLFPCILIFRVFFIRSAKECVYVIMLKIALVLVKTYVLVGKKGISG